MENLPDYLRMISLWTFVAVFLGGVATSFTPCVYPIIPIIVGVVGASQERSKIRNFFLSIAYVLGMALTFSVLGVVAALAGKVFGQFQMTSTVHLVLGGIMIVFALSLFDVIRIPVFWLNKAGAGTFSKGGNFLNCFIMGASSGLIAAPCATAVLGALLAYVASTRNVILGFSMLFTYAAGIGVLLVVVGTFSGILANLPRSAKWLGVVNKLMASIVLILGCYFIFKAGTLGS